MRLIWAVVGLAFLPVTAWAGAWPQPKGETQVIASFEPGMADLGFDDGGGKTIALGDWQRTELSASGEYGLNARLTLTAKVNLRDYHTEFTDFSGLTSVEIGGRWTIRRTDGFVLAAGATVEGLGQGKRSDIDIGMRGGTDTDLRLYFGNNFKLLGKPAFSDIQVARHLRQYEADQWRIDVTLGLKPSRDWMILGQVFSGETDRQTWGQAQWTNSQVSVVRYLGLRRRTALQLGLRQTVAGRNVPAVRALVMGVWKTF